MLTPANATVQLSVSPAMRGRVMALYMMMLMGGTPLGAPIVGWVGRDFRRPVDPDRRRRDVHPRHPAGGAGVQLVSALGQLRCPANAPTPRPAPTRRWPHPPGSTVQAREPATALAGWHGGEPGPVQVEVAHVVHRGRRPDVRRVGPSTLLAAPGPTPRRRCASLGEAALVGRAERDESRAHPGRGARRRALAGCARRCSARRARPGAARSGADRRPRPAAVPRAPPGARRARPPGRSTHGRAGRRCRARPRRGSATRSGAATRRRAGR